MNDSRNTLKFDFASPPPAPRAPTPAPLPRPFLNVREAADLIGVTEGAMRKHIVRDALPCGVVLRIGARSLRIDREKLIAWVRSRPVHAAETAASRS